MTYLAKVDLEVLREVGRSEAGLQIFTLHRRLSLGPAQLGALVRSLVKRELVLLSVDLDRVQLTDKGFEALAAIRGRGSEQPVKSSAAEWIYRPRLGINFPYLPRRSKM